VTSANYEQPIMTKTDNWSHLEEPEAVARAVDRLMQLDTIPSEIAARRRILELMAVESGHRVLDVGAGIGTYAAPLAELVGPSGRVVALDPSAALLGHIASAASLETVVGDARAMPLEDNTFDRALCHWVLLHIDPMAAVVNEMKRVVAPNGTLTCVEVDWDTAIVHPGDRELTRAILHAGADRPIDGWAGRRLVPLLRECGLDNVTVEPIVDVHCDGNSGGWLPFVESRVDVAVSAGRIQPEEGARWWADIERAAAEQRYFFSVTQFVVQGRKAVRRAAGG
jgi:ubiquinone/menaquinone biosynthesis C-methylase UbiE